jgi:hypothetical protein
MYAEMMCRIDDHITRGLSSKKITSMSFLTAAMETRQSRSPFTNEKGESFAVRRKKAYFGVDKLFSRRGGTQASLINAFLHVKASISDPVHVGCNYTALNNFLSSSSLTELHRGFRGQGEETVTALLDDRRDSSLQHLAIRNWDAYAIDPPSGDPNDVFFKKLGAHTLYKRLQEPVECMT